MYNDIVECPYCGFENDMSDGCCDLPSNNMFDHTCTQCNEEFEVLVEFEPSYSADKIEYEICDCCNKESRDFYNKGRVFPFPKCDFKVLCKKCFYKILHEERENK